MMTYAHKVARCDRIKANINKNNFNALSLKPLISSVSKLPKKDILHNFFYSCLYFLLSLICIKYSLTRLVDLLIFYNLLCMNTHSRLMRM